MSRRALRGALLTTVLLLPLLPAVCALCVSGLCGEDAQHLPSAEVPVHEDMTASEEMASHGMASHGMDHGEMPPCHGEAPASESSEATLAADCCRMAAGELAIPAVFIAPTLTIALAPALDGGMPLTLTPRAQPDPIPVLDTGPPIYTLHRALLI